MSLQQKMFNNISSKICVARMDILRIRQFSQSDNKETDKETPNSKKSKNDEKPKELNGPKGPEPTRYGDWERKGRKSILAQIGTI
ncbi:hypothetical protein Mgra_00005038 [Meloidogyne graminicola]|uniref:Succinate dehydrogenase assembly factor 4, mitochondrial n=1 Tax=Meloidogyne graminicola TaxID=189291 RepID=A0A8S9ZQ19_9BILA|nr:hypothetical protein Mgra_00005038 [Meloidogyne graminicola]